MLFSYQDLKSYYAFMWKSRQQNGALGKALQKLQLRFFKMNQTITQDQLWSSPSPLNPEVSLNENYILYTVNGECTTI